MISKNEPSIKEPLRYLVIGLSLCAMMPFCGGCAVVAIAAGIAAGSTLIAQGVEAKHARERANSNQGHPGRREGAVAKKEDLSAVPTNGLARTDEATHGASRQKPIVALSRLYTGQSATVNNVQPPAPSRDILSLMHADLSARKTTIEKFSDYCDHDVPAERHGEFLLVKGVYAWSLFVATLDQEWKTQTLESFRSAADCGIMEPSELMGEHWNSELQSNWSVATKR